jgi:hypothetical protein
MKMMVAAVIAGSILGGSVLAGAAFADEAAPQVYRLAPADIARAQADGAARRDVFDPSQWPTITDRRVHGEVSAFVGTGGARGVAGSATVPLGQSGSASFAFENSDYGNRSYRRPY